MGRWSKIFFSREHTGRSSDKREVDTYRQKSDSSKVEKIGHNPTTDVKIKIKTGK